MALASPMPTISPGSRSRSQSEARNRSRALSPNWACLAVRPARSWGGREVRSTPQLANGPAGQGCRPQTSREPAPTDAHSAFPILTGSLQLVLHAPRPLLAPPGRPRYCSRPSGPVRPARGGCCCPRRMLLLISPRPRKNSTLEGKRSTARRPMQHPPGDHRPRPSLSATGRHGFCGERPPCCRGSATPDDDRLRDSARTRHLIFQQPRGHRLRSPPASSAAGSRTALTESAPTRVHAVPCGGYNTEHLLDTSASRARPLPHALSLSPNLTCVTHALPHDGVRLTGPTSTASMHVSRQMLFPEQSASPDSGPCLPSRVPGFWLIM
ncbi:hypothetical protein B0J12DRAFT_763679 [Macrophomina phaseolina]|uniref:Uncharacterized protein n=1 Tax=Macrophomina phaseolina TaxID=35725 RepID=A0ABQ8GTJ0_9PEZI|nr:hypothetical protein B0J12DRAFT_763679 [Macrophomina phaseolina]